MGYSHERYFINHKQYLYSINLCKQINRYIYRFFVQFINLLFFLSTFLYQNKKLLRTLHSNVTFLSNLQIAFLLKRDEIFKIFKLIEIDVELISRPN